MNTKIALALTAMMMGAAIPASAQTSPPLSSHNDGTGASVGQNQPGRADANAEAYRDATQSTPKHFGGISKGQNAVKRKTDTNNGK